MRQFVAHNRMLDGRLRDRGPAGDAGRHRRARSCASSARSTRSPRARPCAPIRRAAPRADIYEIALPRRALRARRRLARPRAPRGRPWPPGRSAGATAGRRCPRRRADVADDGRARRRRATAPRGLRRSSWPASVGIAAARARVSVADAHHPHAASAAGRRGHRPAAAAGPPRPRPAPRTPHLARRCCSTSRPSAHPDDVFFLFEDRATRTAPARSAGSTTSCAACSSVGVRQGEHVGVLMATRPSALAVVAALNRLGAVAVLLRPDGDTAREVELGRGRAGSSPTPSTPRRAGRRAAASRCSCSAAARRTRDLGAAVVDMERDRPRRGASLPGLVPRPTRAARATWRSCSSPATASGTRANRITNGRWALSAFGTASSAALTDADTVYTVTPHPPPVRRC